MKCPNCKSENVRQSKDLLWIICNDCKSTFLLTRIKMEHIPLGDIQNV